MILFCGMKVFLRVCLVLMLVTDHASSFPAVSKKKQSVIRMDTEGSPSSAKYVVQQNVNVLRNDENTRLLTIPPPPPPPSSSSSSSCAIEAAQAHVGMPWRTSIDPSQSTLLYMPFWKWQMEFMKQNLNNLRPAPVTNLDGTMDFKLKENRRKNARIVNLCFESDEYRRIRLTYYDAGKKTQVFNSLFYPRGNLPVLGIDLLQFNGKKHLAVVDFQPIHSDERHHDAPYHHLMEPIQSQYPSLQGKMSNRFYDETQFFSQHMLFARFEDEGVVHNELFPAFQQYVSTHVNDLVKKVTVKDTPYHRHAAYDAYSAQRDPATGMFEQVFSKEWADQFVHEFLFPLSRQR